jgi:HlyD family secretion protein
VPNAALRFKPKQVPASAPNEHGQRVWLPDGDEAKLMKVKTGITDGTWSEVIEGAIAEGQEVIVGLVEKEKK